MARESLAAARVEAHWAVQVIAAAADRWIARRDDDSHTAMTWIGDRRMLRGEAAPSGLAIGLVLDELALVALRGADAIATLPLAGERLAGAMAWADRQHAGAAGEPPRGIHARDYDMPARPDAPFARDRDALAELAGWYSRGHGALSQLGPLHVWPHHFDLGTIVFLDPPGEHARQIGAGLSPGDRYYAEPYLYVTPYPIADGGSWPPLDGGGVWRHEGWTGAVLTATAIAAGGDPGAFVRSAIEGARSVIA